MIEKKVDTYSLKKKLNIQCLLTLFRNPLHTLTYNYLMGALITNWRASKLFHRLICSSWVQIYQFPVLPITNQIEMWIRWLGLPFGMRVLFAYRTFQYPLITRTTTTMMTVMNSIPRESGSERLCLIPCAGLVWCGSGFFYCRLISYIRSHFNQFQNCW